MYRPGVHLYGYCLSDTYCYKCSICHEPHQTERPSLLARDEQSLCQKCHGSHADFGHPVGPNVIDPRTAAAVTCMSCHTPHASQHTAILTDNPSRALCVRCHSTSGMGMKTNARPRANEPSHGK